MEHKIGRRQFIAGLWPWILGAFGVGGAWSTQELFDAAPPLAAGDAPERPVGTFPVGEIPPKQGDTIVLNLDSAVQQQVEQSLTDGLSWARASEAGANATSGAAVVLDPKTGHVVAMASNPVFDPGSFVGGIGQGEFDELLEASAFTDLAIQGQYPPGSSFKAVTYATAVEHNVFPAEATQQSPEGSILCEGVLRIRGLSDGSQQVFTDPGHGIVDLHRAFAVSCNIYFWEVALAIWSQNKNTGNEGILQEMARRLGLGSQTGIDLPFEAAGQIPDRALFTEWAETAPYRLSPDRIDPGPIWKGGDLMNVAIGQGETLATPLQMAVAYAAMSNGGTVWRPTVVNRLVDHSDGTTTRLDPEIAFRIAWSAGFQQSFLQDLGRTITSEYGTARRAFSSMTSSGIVGGKTGTSTTNGKGDTAWFVGVAPIASPDYVVAVVVDQGGSGGTVAAPIARQIFQYLYGEQVHPIGEGL
ncbi:MAG: hypothetical protein JJE47_15350 [Acidimicrobiia bacterium]|nr:hypothetical protein [Acidimicrobiia bacterium]